MKFIHVYATPDGESHWEPLPIEFLDGGRRTDLQAATSIRFIQRETNDYMEPHPVGQPQYVLYLSVRVEIGLSDGTTVINEPGDVMFVEDTPPHCVEFVTLKDGDLLRGQQANRVALRTFAKCLKDGVWPGPRGDRVEPKHVEMTTWHQQDVD